MISRRSLYFLGAATAMICLPLGATLQAHGMFHRHTSGEEVGPHESTPHDHDHSGHTHDGKSAKSEVPLRETEDCWWSVAFSTGWESRHVHYGVDETGVGGAYVNEIGINIQNLSLNVWNGLGLGNDFLEWDFTVGYTVELGPIFITPGYNFRYTPGDAHSHGEHSGHDDHDHDHDHHHEEEAHGHDYRKYGHELFVVVGTTAIPYVTPSVGFLWDLTANPGGILEIRLDGDIPVWKKVLSLQPYALFGLNFGYNTDQYYGWNNFQLGLQATWAFNRHVSVYSGINYSVAMEALRQIDQGNVVWANVGLSFSF